MFFSISATIQPGEDSSPDNWQRSRITGQLEPGTKGNENKKETETEKRKKETKKRELYKKNKKSKKEKRVKS